MTHRAVLNALDHLQRAQRLVDLAAQELCPVPGLADEWEDLRDLYHEIRNHWCNVEGHLPPTSTDDHR